MARRDIEAGKAFVRLSVQRGGFEKGMRAARDTLRAFGTAAKIVSGTAIAAGGAVTAGLTASVLKFAAAGDKLDKMSARTGVSAQALSELGFAAERSGTNIGEVEKGIRRMQRTIVDAAEGTKESKDALDRLGVSASELQGLTPEKQFEMLGQRVAAIQDPTLQAAAAMELFGRSGTSLVPMLRDMESLRGQARDLGATMTDEQATAAAVVTDAFTNMQKAIAGVTNRLGSAFAPAAAAVLDGLTAVAVASQDVVEKVEAFVVRGIEAIRNTTGALRIFVDNAAKVGAALLGEGGFAAAWEEMSRFIGAVWDSVTGSIVATFAKAINHLITIAEIGSKQMIVPLLEVGKAINSIGVVASGLLTGQSADEIRATLKGLDIAQGALANTLGRRVSETADFGRGVAGSLESAAEARARRGAVSLITGLGGFDELLETIDKRISGGGARSLGLPSGGDRSALRQGLGTAGSFSAAALAGIGRGPEERTAKNTEAMKKELEGAKIVLEEINRGLLHLGFR